LVADPTCESLGPDTARAKSCVVSISRNFDCRVSFAYNRLDQNPWFDVKYGGATGSASVETCFGFTTHVGRSLQVCVFVSVCACLCTKMCIVVVMA
jgi:hypothetical protein